MPLEGRGATAGGDDSTYQSEGANLFTISELLSPYRATANLCRLQWLPPFAVLGIHRGLADELIRSHAADYRRMVTAFRDEMIDLEAITDSPYLNSNLAAIIKQS